MNNPKTQESQTSPDLFVGRCAEMAELFSAWRLAKSGRPQIVVLIGDSGLGKTRMIHEFYRRINIEEKGKPGNGYWPDILDPDPVSLRMNPRIEGKRDITLMPWLWCGARWQNPGLRNAITHSPCGLVELWEALRIHGKPLLDYYKKKHSANEALKETGSSALILGLELFLPVVSKTADLGRTLLASYTRVSDMAKSRGQHNAIDYPRELANRHRSLDGRLRDVLRAFLDSECKEIPQVPVILVLDDAQWADAATLRFVRDILEEAAKFGWRLLVIASCWESTWKEWMQVCDRPHVARGPEIGPENLKIALNQLGILITSLKGHASPSENYHREIVVSRFVESKSLEPLIKAKFPGLGEAGCDYLLEKAYGNPKVLDGLLRQMQRRKTTAWFRDGTPNSDLTPPGWKALRDLPIDHKEIVESQLSLLEEKEPEVFDILVRASPQGIHFYGALVAAVSARLQPTVVTPVEEALKHAETPWNLISIIPSKLLSAEFKEVFARDKLIDDAEWRYPQLRQELLTVLTEWFDTRRFDGTPEALQLLGILHGLLLAGDPECQIEQENSKWRLLLRVMARKISLLYEQWRFAEALRCAEELCNHVTNPGQLVGVIDACDQTALGTCLMEGRCYRIILDLASARKKHGLEDNLVWAPLEAKALTELERFEEAIVAWETTLATEPRSPEEQRHHKELSARVRLGLAEALHRKRGWKEALPQCQAAVDEVTTLCQSDQNTPATQELAGRIRMRMAQIIYDSGDLVGAVRQIKEAEKRFSFSLDLGGPIPSLLFAYSSCLAKQGDWRLRHVGGEPIDAPEAYNRALEIRVNLEKMIGRTPEMLSSLAASHAELGTALAETGQLDKAEDEMKRAVEDRKNVLLRVPNDIAAVRHQSMTLVSYGNVLRKAGKLENALQLYEEALEKRKPPVELQVKGYAKALTIITNAANAIHVFFAQSMAATDLLACDAQAKRDIRNLHYAWRKIGEVQLAMNLTSEATTSLAIAVRLSQWVRRHCSLTFALDEIKSFSGIINRLKQQSDPVSAFLWQRLSNPERLVLENFQISAPSPNPAQYIIVRTLNVIIGEPRFYEHERFNGIILSSETSSLLQQNLSGSNWTHLNRKLLEDVYSQELSRVPSHDPTDLHDGYVGLKHLAKAHENAGDVKIALRRIHEAIWLIKKFKTPQQTTRQDLGDMEATKLHLQGLLKTGPI